MTFGSLYDFRDPAQWQGHEPRQPAGTRKESSKRLIGAKRVAQTSTRDRGRSWNQPLYDEIRRRLRCHLRGVDMDVGCLWRFVGRVDAGEVGELA